MSAESHRKQSIEKSVGKVILPQAVEDKSLIDSFTGFIHDVVPQAYSSVPSENKEKILWARFEYTDVNDPLFHTDVLESVSVGPPILLVLGYSFGAQIWSISGNGEATELLSWFHGTTKFLKLIPSPLADNQKQDPFAHRRPLVAICDGASSSQFCSINFVSLRGGDVKSIKFKSPVLDIAVNRISVVVSFLEKIAIFNALTLENHYTITTCYVSPGLNINPIALGSRWLAYSENRLLPWLKSAGGCESECAPSYTATVLNAAKTLGQGLRDLSGSVASSFGSNLSTSPGTNSYMHMAGGGFHRSDSNSSINSNNPGGDNTQPGIITIVDIKSKLSDDEMEKKNGIVAHFVAHPGPIVGLCFDSSGVLLLTADKKGHRFHVFRIQPHLLGSSFTSIHHLYVLYRGDTSARVQDMTFSVDSRWVAVSSLRGTTHVFPVTPYGGPIGLRTHSTPHVVNKLSRFHRSAGIISDGRNSPVLHETLPLSSSPTSMSFTNPCLPPFPHPTVVTALAQIRSQSTLLSQSRHSSSQNQDENCLPALKVVACFSPPRTLDGFLSGHITTSYRKSKNAVDSLFIMSCQGTLTQYNLEPLAATGIPKDKLCDESAIELKIETKVEWYLLQMPPSSSSTAVIEPPLVCGNPLLSTYSTMKQEVKNMTFDEKSYPIDEDNKWLSQVEIVTHIGPHRRIWMGPQFTFKTIQKNGSNDLDTSETNIAYAAKSNPVNMPANYSKNQSAPLVPLYIESGSSSSLEQSPRLLEMYGGDSDSSFGTEELKIQEDIADAMLESPVNATATKCDLSDSETVEDTTEKQSLRKNRRAKKKRR